MQLHLRTREFRGPLSLERGRRNKACGREQAVFEPEEHAAAPLKSTVAAAAELTGLLAGSSLVNPRKGGAGTVDEISSAPQVRPAPQQRGNCRAAQCIVVPGRPARWHATRTAYRDQSHGCLIEFC